MQLSAVMDEVASALGTIGGLRVYAWPPGTIWPPAAVVAYPTRYTFDDTYGRGTDRFNLPLVLVVGRATERTARDELSAYVDGSGAASIKAVLEAHTWTTCDALRVVGAEFDIHSFGGVDYLAAVFDLDIAGPGGS